VSANIIVACSEGWERALGRGIFNLKYGFISFKKKIDL
jgi:hypothetical protein